MSLTEIIQKQLPLSVHDYMQLCLQHPEHGYYRKAAAVGKEGDFITAPEISQIFGDLIGLWFRDIWQQSGEGEVVLVELGPGRGTLSSDILRHFKPSELHLVESNETLRDVQAKLLWQHSPQWHDSIELLPSKRPLFIIANEFFDAFPIRQWVGDEERMVNEDFKFIPEGKVTREECPQAKEIIAQICQRLKAQGGVLLMADYGYAEGEQGGTLQAVKNHAYANPLEDCGKADLTSHLDFQALAKVAKEEGCVASSVVEQEKFLRSLGGEVWLQKLLTKTPDIGQQKTLLEGWMRLISPAQMGTLFKLMAITPDDSLTLGGF